MADKVFVVANPLLTMAPADTVARALAQLMKREQAGMVWVGGTNVSMGIGSFLAAETGLPFVNYCRAAKASGGGVDLVSQLFGGKILADVRLADARGIVSISPGAFPLEAGKTDKAVVVEPVELAVDAPRTAFVKYLERIPGMWTSRNRTCWWRWAAACRRKTISRWRRTWRTCWAARCAPRGR